MKKTITALAVALLFSSAHAQYMNGNELLTKIRSNGLDRGIAIGYIGGVADANLNVSFCPPDGVTLGQIEDMTRRVLEAKPEMRHHPADLFVLASLSKWPCKPKGSAL